MKVRSFVIADKLPIPPMGGADLRSALIVRALSQLGPVAVFGVGHRPDQEPPFDGVEVWRSTPREAAIDHNKAVGGHNWLQHPEWRPSDRYYSPAIAEDISGVLAAFRPDIVVLSQLAMAAYLETAQSSQARLVLDAHNVEALLQDEIAEAAGSPVEIAIRRHFAQRTRLLEADTIGAVDAVWACSLRDQELLRTTYPAPRVDVVPNGLVVSDYDEIFSARATGPIAAPTIVFPAQFGYPPNRRGADWLLSEIAPAIRLRVPGVTFAMPGRDPSPRMMQAAAAGEALVPGAVPSMLPFLANADLMVVPLREGSGTRLKILEAFASGIPVISTAKGVEGLNVIAGEHYLQAETPDQFANAVATLARGSVTNTFRRNSRSFVEAGFSADAVIGAVEIAVTALLA